MWFFGKRGQNEAKIDYLEREVNQLGKRLLAAEKTVGLQGQGSMLTMYWESHLQRQLIGVDRAVDATPPKPRVLNIKERLLRLENIAIPKCGHCGVRECEHDSPRAPSKARKAK